jgi:hypothetical protein
LELFLLLKNKLLKKNPGNQVNKFSQLVNIFLLRKWK